MGSGWTISRRSLICAVIVSVALPTVSARAAPAVEGSVALVPTTAGASPTLTAEARLGKTLASEFEAPRSIVLAIARGFRFDPRARSRACSAAQASAYSCPEESRIGRGNATVVVSGAIVPGGTATLNAAVDVYLAPRAQPGDLLGVEVQVREPATGQRGRGSGRLVPVANRTFGSELRFDNFPQPPQPPPGVTVEVPRISFTLGASRLGKRFYYGLVRNPPTCPSGGWPFELRISFPSGESRRAGTVPCNPAPRHPGCPAGGDPIVATRAGDVRSGSRGRDILFGLGGRDLLLGLGGADCLYGGSGADRLSDSSGRDRFWGGSGNDRIDARDRSRRGRRTYDRVNCGAGRDTARVDRVDRVSANCERVRGR